MNKQIEKLLDEEQKKMLLELKQNDEKVYDAVIVNLIRFNVAVKSGNIKLAQKIEKTIQNNINLVLETV